MKVFKLTVWIAALVIVFYGGKYAYDLLSLKSQAINSYEDSDVSGNQIPDTENKGFTSVQYRLDEPVTAQDFVLTNREGEEVSLSDYKGKTVVLNFWASWCPPCKAEMPEFNKLNQEFLETGDIVLLTVNLTDGQRETKEIAEKYLDDNGYTFEVLFDTELANADNMENSVTYQYNVSSIPTTIIIDKEGMIRKTILGQSTKDMVWGYINEVNK